MIIIQKYHSLNEIDQEFRQSLTLLVKDEYGSFEEWIKEEESYPLDVGLHYYLFFGNQNNLPIGISVLKLTPLDPVDYLPFYKRFLTAFFQDSTIMKHAKWSIGSGSIGSLMIHPRFWRQAREEFQKLLFNIEGRDDILCQTIVENDHDQKTICHWEQVFFDQSINCYFLLPLQKTSKNYEEFIGTKSTDIMSKIKSAWKKIHKDEKLDIQDKNQLLSFVNDHETILSMPYKTGTEGRLFLELNLNQAQNISLFQRVQYALMKFHEEDLAYTLILTQDYKPLQSQDAGTWNELLELGFTQSTRIFHHRSRSQYVK